MGNGNQPGNIGWLRRSGGTLGAVASIIAIISAIFVAYNIIRQHFDLVAELDKQQRILNLTLRKQGINDQINQINSDIWGLAEEKEERPDDELVRRHIFENEAKKEKLMIDYETVSEQLYREEQ